MALNFPNTPTDNQNWTDPNGQTWVYALASNSWTALGAPSGGMAYKGGIDITAAPPAGVKPGWLYTVTTAGTANAGFAGLTGTVVAGTQVVYSGTGWQQVGTVGPWTRSGTELSPVNAGDSVFTSGAVKVGGTTAAPNIQLKADGGIVANTNGLVYDATNKWLGIGTASPVTPLTVSNGSEAPLILLSLENTANIDSGSSALFKNELVFRGDKQNRYSGAGAVIGPLASISAVYANTSFGGDFDQGAGALTFSTRTRNSATASDTLTERFRIDDQGYLRMAAGTGGIQFGGDTAAANALDDYEEGTFTPTVQGTATAGVGTYTTQGGKYTKIGNKVYFNIDLTWTAHTGTGNIRIVGLPFTVVTGGPCANFFNNYTFTAGLRVFSLTQSTRVELYATPDTGGTIATFGLDTAASVSLSGFYSV